MDAFDYGVSFEQKISAGDAEVEDSAIVAGSGFHEIIRGQASGQFRDEFEFAHLLHLVEQEEIVCGVEERVGEDRRDEVVGGFVEEN